MTERPAVIAPVDPDEDRSTLRELLSEFHEWMTDHVGDAYAPEDELAEDLRSLEEETDSWAWIARSNGEPVGCVLLYGESAELAEFRRLYVRPDYRSEGVGRTLVRTVIDHARTRDYETLGLTTPPWSETAIALYESMDFERTPPYPETRLPERYHDGAIFMQLDLNEREDEAANT